MLALLCSLVVLATGCEQVGLGRGAQTSFSGQAALEYAQAQVDFGPRVPGTEGHRNAGDWIVEQMRQRADTVIVQEWTHVTHDGDSLPMRNILARVAPAMTQRVLYVVHWDTRPIAENAERQEDRDDPILGANDGASGVGLLVALADVLRETPPQFGVDLLFVDGEDYGTFPDRDVLIGSRYFANNLPSENYQPLFGVVWDMVGAEGATFHYEGYSSQGAPEVVTRVWQTAADLGYARYFVARTGGPVTDDHLPLLEKGLRVIDVIDITTSGSIRYPHHHRLTDTMDKLSVRTLQAVGDVATALVVGAR